ncbi:hypothetical protein [Flavobacterium sp. LB2P6]|uniref:hypothetical protein n=1 Tax=Flavobacterium sp. LB2P6 TaxID=3401714 RepID=UPI003AAC3C3D
MKQVRKIYDKAFKEKAVHLVMIEQMYHNSPESWESQHHSCINGVKNLRNFANTLA